MILLAIKMAWPCAGLLHADGVHVESSTQQVIFSLQGDNTKVDYQIQYEGNAEDFGWVVPIFGPLVDIQEGDPNIFSQYDEWTSPSVTYEYAPEQSCTPVEKGLADNSFSQDSYISGFAGQFEYIVVPASQGEDFVDWAQGYGWNTDGVSSILPQYGSESTISMVLLRIRQDIILEEISTSPTISIEYERHEMRYPAMLSKISIEPELHTVVYIQGDAQATVGGWGLEEVGDILGSTQDNATDLFTERLREISDSRTSFGLVFSGEINGTWVTRLDSLLRPEQNTHEPFFQIGSEVEEVSTTITLSETSTAWVWGLMLTFFSMFGYAKRRAETIN